ncbi:TKL family protein kinase [Trichomonas vaginalis G3]|uniref:TKL family protein kinase n=1 Tax=Trichomonas vaginalis (strain ATCC PRA-98 / G3) TaxID=412133 RepID=A2EJK9_TRIV3|nr:protein kinase protein [Trichomonas vaginalis G3]EAY07179.1 TKL family protein kinase [Trichomonas vaginalis G3]KAI5503638.1 protein kinase protein [Trichomonas vaginalis G3]|eukprot:XP_001319402.1 TKL family protein kinase [Trichomonas vaginalis G3]
MNDLLYLQHPNPKPQWVEHIESIIQQLLSVQGTIIVHRSKLFALMDDFRALHKNFDPDIHAPQEKLKQASSELVEAINKTNQLAYYSSTAHWSQPAITWPSSYMRDNIRRIREDVHESLIIFGCRNCPNFLISEEQLNAQNDVDILQLKGSLMEYLAQVQGQPQTPQMQGVISLINERLRSIGPLEGIQDGPALVCVPPFLPAKLNYVLSHDAFTIGNTIGTGTFGSVHIGTMNATNRKVAVKVLNTQILGGRQLETFKREVWTMATLNHPSILRLVGVTLTPPFCIVTELLKGSLYDRLKFLSPTKRSIIALKVAQGMEQLHAARIIHRDLKSANILLDEDDMPRVCDFGLVGFKTGATRTGYVGTAQWMAPEVLRSSPFYDEKVDVYSFGVLLWEMLTLHEPYSGMKQEQIVMGVIESGLRPLIPQNFSHSKLVQLIERCWSEQPSMRPPFSTIATLLMQADFHFFGTNETEFQAANPSTLISINLVQAYDSCNWSRFEQLLKSVTREETESDTQLLPVIITLFSGLSVELQSYLVSKLSTMVDFEVFIAQSGYNFILSMFNMAPQVVSSLVTALRQVDLSSKCFRQVKLIGCLADSKNSDVTQLCADLCEYNDIADYIVKNKLPLKNVNDKEVIWLYNNLLMHAQLAPIIAQQQEPIMIAAARINDYPLEICLMLESFPFNETHGKMVHDLQLITKLAAISDMNSSALKVINALILTIPAEFLKDEKNIIERVVKRHRVLFKALEMKLTEELSIKLHPIDWSTMN